MTELFEANRLKELYSCLLLDTEAEKDFDDITNLAALMCGTPMALVSLVDTDRLWFKSKFGIEVNQVPRSKSLCEVAISLPNKTLVVNDTSKDQRFFNAPLVVNPPKFAFYVGVPLVTSSDYAIGTLCVMDTVPNALNENQIKSLESLANQIVRLIDLRKKSKLVETQNEILNQKQTAIISSIEYAKKLQDAMLPSLELITSLFPDNFLINKPKDIVSGDFYWLKRHNNLVFVAVADGTGHGVPGAMVSVVCNNALNRSVIEYNLSEPNLILDKARELIVETFSKNNLTVRDGMDISLLCIDRGREKISWSGAINPIWYIHKGEFKKIAGNSQPVGKIENFTPFTKHEIEYNKNDVFYLFTDGLTDQFGGAAGKRYKRKRLEEFLKENSVNSLDQQHEAILNEHQEWKGELEQVDDICLLAIRI